MVPRSRSGVMDAPEGAPETAAKLFAEAQVEADARYETYVALAHSYNKD